MMKRFLSMIAILAISLLTACAQTPDTAASDTAQSGKMCNPEMMRQGCECMGMKDGKCMGMKKHTSHHKRHHTTHAVQAVSPSSAPAATDAHATIPNQEKKGADMMEGVKKIIKDVKPKDTKKPE